MGIVALSIYSKFLLLCWEYIAYNIFQISLYPRLCVSLQISPSTIWMPKLKITPKLICLYCYCVPHESEVWTCLASILYLAIRPYRTRTIRTLLWIYGFTWRTADVRFASGQKTSAEYWSACRGASISRMTATLSSSVSFSSSTSFSRIPPFCVSLGLYMVFGGRSISSENSLYNKSLTKN